MTLGSQSIKVLDRPETSASVSRPPIDDHRVARAIKLIDTSGICARVDKWRAEDRERAGKGPGGRPASLDDRMVLVIMLALVLEGSPLLVTHAAAAVKYRLSEQAKAMLGIDPDKVSNIDWYDRYWRAFHIFVKIIDRSMKLIQTCYRSSDVHLLLRRR